ncbi:MAG: xylose isomerase [Verrucomicrobia bacterium]|nr:MAG: xylose isomerase [Verrucomicrobiota bacterium]
MPAKTAAINSPPQIYQIVNLWSLWDYPSARKEWTLEKKIAAVKEAGFDGFSWQLEAEHARLAAKYNLRTMGYFSSAKPTEFKSLIQQNLDHGAVRINVQLGDHDTPVEKAIAMAVRLVELGDAMGIPCDIEVHRDTCTETPEKTYAIAAGFKKATGQLIPLTWDFSHLSVIKHLTAPYWDRLLVAPQLIQHSRQIHFRPFNGHHAQIPVTDGSGKISHELSQWIPFLEKTLEMWLAGKQTGKELYVCPEMGPVRGGYNFAQLPNSWEDAQVLRGIIFKAWKKCLAASR